MTTNRANPYNGRGPIRTHALMRRILSYKERGYTAVQIGPLIGVNPSTVRHWILSYQKTNTTP